MGVLTPMSTQVGPSAQPPIGTRGNFPARMSAESPSNISPDPSEVISEVSEIYDKPFLNIFEISRLSGQNRVKWGGRGVPPQKNSYWNLTIYVPWESMQKFGTL